MHVILGIFIAFPAFVFAVFALALGLPVARSAAVGAILGMLSLAAVAIMVIQHG